MRLSGVSVSLLFLCFKEDSFIKKQENSFFLAINEGRIKDVDIILNDYQM